MSAAELHCVRVEQARAQLEEDHSQIKAERIILDGSMRKKLRGKSINLL